jgi:hypothetical protein
MGQPIVAIRAFPGEIVEHCSAINKGKGDISPERFGQQPEGNISSQNP